MIIGNKRRGLLALVACLGCASAPRFSNMDADQLFQYATERLAAHKWEDASRALDQFVFQFPTDERYQEARYRVGEAHSGKGEYLIAASEFARLASDFPAGPWAERARFEVCDSYFRLSPKPQLDQEYTHTAIDQCQVMLAYYPAGEWADTVRTMLSTLQNKLATKELEAGLHYFKRGAYDSAILYYDKVLASYPVSPAAPKALFGLYRSYEEIGWTEEARQARERLLRDFPESAEAKQVQSGSAVAPS
jgi:outer membrane protein assembly factor BamD